MNALKRIIRVMDLAVFAFKTIAIGGVFYEGMTLRWYEKAGAVHVGTHKFDFFPFTCGYMKKEL